MDQRIGRLERLVDVLTERMDTVDEWVSESKKFHRDMNTFKDTFIGTQTAMRDEQSRRHQTNTDKLNWIIALGTIALIILTGLGIVVSIQIAKHEALNHLVGHQPYTTAHISELPNY